MKFKRISSHNNKEFEEAWKIYEYSFPSDERRSLEKQIKILNNNDYSFSAVYNSGILCGIIAAWNFNKFSFIEHIAVKEELRNKGLGSKMIKEFQNESKKMIILETEWPSAGEMANRRIGFWKRNGFKLNEYDYIQPAYGKDKSPVPLCIMSLPNFLKITEFRNIRNAIHKKVYDLKIPIKGRDK